MSGVIVCQLGMLLFVLCLSAQIVAQTVTDMPSNTTGNNTGDGNTTMGTPVTNSNPNATTPKSAMSPLNPAGVSMLLIVAMVTSLLNRFL